MVVYRSIQRYIYHIYIIYICSMIYDRRTPCHPMKMGMMIHLLPSLLLVASNYYKYLCRVVKIKNVNSSSICLTTKILQPLDFSGYIFYYNNTCFILYLCPIYIEGGGKCEYVHFGVSRTNTKVCSWKTNITRKFEKYSPETCKWRRHNKST